MQSASYKINDNIAQAEKKMLRFAPFGTAFILLHFRFDSFCRVCERDFFLLLFLSLSYVTRSSL